MVDYSISVPDYEVMPKPASFLKRLIAYLIDLIIFNFIIYSPFMAVFESVSGLSAEMLTIEYVSLRPDVLAAYMGALSASLVLLLAYFMFFEFLFGQTIGKQFLGLRVVCKRKSLLSFFLRGLLKSVLFPLLILDCVGILLLRTKQRFIDALLGVTVLSSGRIQLMSGYA